MPTLLKCKVLGRVWLALTESHIESHARPWLGRVGTLIDSFTKIAHSEEDESLRNEIEILGRRWREWRLSIQKEKPRFKQIPSSACSLFWIYICPDVCPSRFHTTPFCQHPDAAWPSFLHCFPSLWLSSYGMCLPCVSN